MFHARVPNASRIALGLTNRNLVELSRNDWHNLGTMTKPRPNLTGAKSLQ